MRALAQGRSPGPQLDSVEFKMLLIPARFDDLDSGLDGFWKQLQSAAEASQVDLAVVGGLAPEFHDTGRRSREGPD